MAEIILSASILSADFSNLSNQILQAEYAGINWLHIDVMDGHFVPNITMGPFIIETCKRISRLPLDVHLMIEKPERYIEAFALAGADIITVHVEGNPNTHRTIQHIRSLGCKAGICINPGTPVFMLEPLIPIVDLVLLMSVNPGFSGQSYMPESELRIADLRQKINRADHPIHLQVDGGITSKTLPGAYQAGADTFVAATAIFKHPQGIAAGIKELRGSINN